MSADLTARLDARARAAGLSLAAELAESLVTYYEVLSLWNRKINLTALSDLDAAIERLLLEPVLAARLLPHPRAMLDMGSGGGSPAIPLALALRAPLLVMVESRGRKAAFLREAARTAGVNAIVEAARFEDLVDRRVHVGSMDIVSMRGVRIDESSLTVARSFAAPDGVIALFTSDDLSFGETTPLIGRSKLVRVHVPRGTSAH
jgi:16S rRNA (guanine527-N7)-methyltransferase